MTLTVGSLFSGIGGLDLGLERAGMRVVWQSEIDPYASAVLAKHWPDVPNLGDVTLIDWNEVPRVDLVCGGYPCQPFSHAGRRGGHTDARHLWPRFADTLRHLRPRYALLENVPGHLSLGFGDVLADLAALGYSCEWDCIPAAAVGAPHLRYRIFVVAYTDSEGESGVDAEPRQGIMVPGRAEQRRALADTGRRRGPDDRLRAGWDESRIGGPQLADPAGAGPSDRGRVQVHGPRENGELERRGGVRRRVPTVADADTSRRHGWTGELRQGRRGESADSGWWSVEPDVGRVAHGIPRRVDRLRTLGNAVVPQVAEWIGRRIVEAAS